MKKKNITEEQINKLINNYTIDLLSSNALSVNFNIPKKRILQILKENNVNVRNSGRIYMGGKSVSDKRYYNKPGIKEKKETIHKKWSSKNREHLKKYHKEWRVENITQHRINKKNYEKTRKSKDPVYKLIGNFRTAIWTVLKENNMTKFGHYFEVLGYSPNDLVKHLESQFKDGIT